MACAILAFSGETRPHPRANKVRVNRAKREGEAVNLVRERLARKPEPEPLPEIGRSPLLAMLVCMYKSMPEDQRKATRGLCAAALSNQSEGWEHFASAWNKFFAAERA